MKYFRYDNLKPKTKKYNGTNNRFCVSFEIFFSDLRKCISQFTGGDDIVKSTEIGNEKDYYTHATCKKTQEYKRFIVPVLSVTARDNKGYYRLNFDLIKKAIHTNRINKQGKVNVSIFIASNFDDYISINDCFYNAEGVEMIAEKQF